MAATYLDAKAYGVGELITHRKMLRVPEHQRDFAWTKEDVQAFLDDVAGAFASSDEYFIGLLVLVGPQEGYWEVLDGQQRLTTVSLLYAALKNWLQRAGYEEDAKQIEQEFLGVRRLGGTYSARLRLSQQNAEDYEAIVLRPQTTEALLSEKGAAQARSTRYRLIEAAIECRSKVQEIAARDRERGSSEAEGLFRLATYLERSLKVVCLDVSSAANAFTIFETLNDRGHDLSVWDLVRNYLYGQAGADGEAVRRYWGDIVSQVPVGAADDFLKVFWTSRYGRVRRGELFAKLRESFRGKAAVDLAADMATAARVYGALADSKNEVWGEFGSINARRLEDLAVLEAKQSRPIIMAARARWQSREFDRLLDGLIAVFVRYQVVSQLRTGQLETTCAVVARFINDGVLSTADDVVAKLAALLPRGYSFESEFVGYSEPKDSRCAWMLERLESSLSLGVDEKFFRDCTVEHIAGRDYFKGVFRGASDVERRGLYNRFGNRCLVEQALHEKMKGVSEAERLRFLASSRFALTRQAADIASTSLGWGIEQIEARQRGLAKIAAQTWPLEIGDQP